MSGGRPRLFRRGLRESKGPRHCLGLLVVLLLGLTVLPSAGAEIGGAYKGLKVSKLEIEGMPEDLAGGIRSQLGLSGKRQLVFFWDEARYYPDVMANDLDRVRLYLARHGYPSARVSASVEPNDDLSEVRVTIDVDPGSMVVIAQAQIEGYPNTVAVPETELIQIGGRFRDDRVQSRRTELQDRLLDLGYATARVSVEVRSLSTTEVAVRWIADPGPRFHIQEVAIQGDVSPDLEHLARKVAGVHEGQLYSRDTVREAEESLRLLGLFRQVRLSVSPIDSTALQLRCDLAEGEQRTLGVGLSWKHNNEVGAFSGWESRNLFLRGRGLSVFGELSTFVFSQQEGSDRWPWVIQTRSWWPALIGSRIRGVVRGSVEHEDELNYELYQTETAAGLMVASSLRLSYEAGVSVSYRDTRSLSPEAEIGSDPVGIVTVLGGRWTLNTLDDRLDPRRGGVSSIQGNFTPPSIGSVAEYWKLEATRSGHVQLGSGVIGAYRLTAGVAQPFGVSSSLPLNERFYAGGQGSHRGYRRRMLGPLDQLGNPEGGELLFLSSAELRGRLRGRLHVAFWVDAGQVWAQAGDLEREHLRFAIGPGLYVSTLVGAIRADLGFPLSKPPEGEPTVLFHLSIGQPF